MKQTIVRAKCVSIYAILFKHRLLYISNNDASFNSIVFFLFITIYCLPNKLIAQPYPNNEKGNNGSYDTLWLSPPNLISLNGNNDPCFILIDKFRSTTKVSPAPLPPVRTTISGNITYDYQYRSLIDTPIYTKNFQQHTLSADIRVLYKGMYPMNIRFQVRKSNQPLFRDFTDINLRFDPRSFTQVIENRIRALLLNKPLPNGLQHLQQLADQLKEERNKLSSFISSPSTLQKIVEARERSLFKQGLKKGSDLLQDKLVKDSFQLDTQDSAIIYQYQQGVERLAVVQAGIRKAEDSLRQAKQMINDSLQNIKAVFNDLKGGKLLDMVKKYHILDDSLPSGYKKLLALRQLSAGRSMVNYSELSAKNISITGINVEYNPSWYAAAAIGFTDWQFRDFRTIQNKLPKQYLALGRFGWGDREKSSVIFSYFTGRRNLLAQYGTGNNGLTSFAISGMSVEGLYHLNPHQQLTVEFAKSSYPKYVGVDPNTGKPFTSSWMTTNDRYNEAYSLSYKGEFVQTKTNLQGSYKRIGRYFQSYAFYNSPGQQDAWNLQLDQRIRKWATLRGGLQKNQYSFPMLAGGLKNDIVFKTIQATIHYKRWPVIMAGYYPSSQITLINNEIPVENRFYTLNISANHSYAALQTYMNSTLVYTRFYNQSSDTGFIYYNAKNISLTQMAWIGKWSLQGSYTAIWQNLGRLNVIEASTSFKASEAFGVTGGIKYNSLLDVTDVIGYSAGCTIMIKKLGALQAMMDKSYWPGQQRNLLPNTNGRLTFVKTF